MKIILTDEEMDRPLGQDLIESNPEARRFFSRVGLVSFWGSDKPVDYAALNRELDEAERMGVEQMLKTVDSGLLSGDDT